MTTATNSKKKEGQTILIKSGESKETTLVRKASAIRESVVFDIKNGTRAIVAPSYDPLVLFNLTHSNNTLLQCIEAMEVNVDGTGCEIIAVDEETDIDKQERQYLAEILAEPYPDMTLISIRRKLRRYLEATGTAYLEVIKTMDGTFIGFKVLESNFCRLSTLSDEVDTQKTMTRRGKEITLTIPDRERCVMYQKSKSDNPIYYKVWGTTQDVNKTTGAFGENLDNDLKATEVIVFTMNDDPETPYGVPRWINQLPSVVGSRKAEEQNLDYFDAGGIPSAIIFLNGGQVSQASSTTLRNYLNGSQSQKNKAVAVEVMSTSGSLDKGGAVNVQVERFGSESVNDSLYRNYDKDCEEHVRLAFRLPPMFVGKASDYNYATAVVAYQVAEAQVFKPERDEFDAIINKVLSHELGLKTCRIRSNPITLRDITTQLRAISLVKDVVSPAEVVNEVGKIADVTLTYIEGKEFPISTSRSSGIEGEVNQEANKGAITKSAKIEVADMIHLAKSYAESKELLPHNDFYTDEQKEQLETIVKSLNKHEKNSFDKLLSLYLFSDESVINAEVIQ